VVKEVFFFTEMGYTAYPQDKAKASGFSNLMFPNEHFSPERASELYRMYFDEYQHASETPGFDGVQINEHHNNPLSMMPSVNVIGSVLSKWTKKGRIVFLGNILPIHPNPIRLAEEIAMMDVISGGRLVSGFVRGIGMESFATNTSPVENRERYDEAHDLVIKTWTTPGPFRWEGKHYNFRVVNPWMLPLQKPHPPIWIPGTTSPETVIWAAKHGYPYIALAPPLELVEDVFTLYDKTAQEAGFTPTTEHRGYVIRVNVADTDEKSYEEGKHFYWQMGTSFGLAHPHWMVPPGYSSRASRQTARGQRQAAERRPQRDISPGGPDMAYEEAQATTQIVTGSPETVIAKLKKILDVVDPAWLVLWGREGNMSHKAAMRSIDLLGQEVIPALKEYVPERAR
jgi:alkanesulfonate monooxygenase SsuD/methylene tetrahydromethanopterin reductase-like flavin-dependent oxidoreductase (luciferase family)